jgi:DNA polymerase-1
MTASTPHPSETLGRAKTTAREQVTESLPPFPTPDYEYVTSVARAVEVCSALTAADTLAIDIETFRAPGCTGENDALDHSRNRIRLLQVGTPDGKATIFDVEALGGLPTSVAAVLAAPERTTLGYNVRFDAGGLLRHFGVEIAKPVDLMHGSILAAGYRGYNKKGTARKGEYALQRDVTRHLGFEFPKDQQTSNWGASVLTQKQLGYAAADVAVLFPLYRKLRTEAEAQGVQAAWDLESEALTSFIALEATGIKVDRSRLEALAAQARADAVTAARNVYAELGAFNLNSRAEIIRRVRAVYGLELKSTSKEHLPSFIGRAPALAHVMVHRSAKGRADMIMTYLDAIEPDGRIRAQHNPMGSATGRCGCSGPALHNVPRSDDIRSAFVPEDGCKFIVADYKAIQLRITAYITGDVELTRCFTSIPEVDPHCLTASLVLGKAMEQVSRGERQLAKAVNFGLTFGMGAKAFVAYARDVYGVTVTLADAHRFRNRFLSRFAGIRAWHARVSRESWRLPGSRTASGRFRLLPKFDGRPPFNEFLASPVQGSEADGLKATLALLLPRLKRIGARLVHVIHDEIVVEVPAELAEQAKAIVVEAMVEGMQRFIPTIPVVVDVVIADSWVKP